MLRNELPTDGLGVYVRLLRYLGPLKHLFIISIIGYLVFAATQPALAMLLEVLVTAIEEKDHDARYYIPAAIAAIYVVRGIGTFLGDYYMALLSNRLVNTLRVQVFGHVMHLPVKFYDDNNSGQIISRIIFNTGMVTGAATDALKILFREGFTVLGLLIYAFYMNWQMSLTFVVIAPIIGLIVVRVGKRMRKLATKVQDSLADITQACSEAVHGNRVVKSFLGERYEINRFTEVTDKNLKQQMRITKLQAINTPVLQLIVVLALGIIVFLVLQPHFLDQMTTGQYVAYITAIGLIPKPLKQLSNINSTIQRGIAAAHNLFTIIDMEPEVNRGTRSAANIRGELEVRNLNFRYPNSNEYALKNINFTSDSGRVVALVGRSGSGKSTLASLIARFYDYEEGEIRVDGIDIREYDLYEYRGKVGLVSQTVHLFNDTVANNIAYGDLSRRDDKQAIERAADSAYATEFIKELPEGFETLIGENGVRLSGGQKQRLAIARALLQDTPILVLDEATSALDNESERAIQMALDKFMQNRTTIVIAHRLSTIENADQILVMAQGRIVESGKHEELLTRNGYYTKLYETGFEQEPEGASTTKDT